MFNKKQDNNTLPEFKITVTHTRDMLTLQFKDNTSSIRLIDWQINGWELDDIITKYIKNLTDSTELHNKLSGK